MAMTFYTNPNSRGRMVRWMLEEIGCTYETVVLDYQPTSQTDRWGGAAMLVRTSAGGLAWPPCRPGPRSSHTPRS